jgi:hypothetical protein
MNYKALGLVAVVAVALMAFVGASSASATVLCKTNAGVTCPANQAWSAGTLVQAVNEGNVTLTTTFKNVECKESTISGLTENEGGSFGGIEFAVTLDIPETEVAPGVKAWDLSFGGCNCNVVVLAGGGIFIEKISGSSNGTLVDIFSELTTSCSTIIGTVHCIYDADGADLGTLTGGPEATIDIEENNLPRLSTSSACAEKASLDANYKVTSPKPLYVTSHT